MISMLFLYFLFPDPCHSENYKILDKNYNRTEIARKEGNITKFYDKNSNYLGQSKQEDNITKFYDKNSNITKYNKGNFYNGKSQFYDKKWNRTNKSKSDKNITIYNRNYDREEEYEKE